MKRSLILAAALVLVASSAFAVNSITVTNAAAMNSTTWGMQTNLDGSTNNVFVESTHPASETHYLFRFWISPATAVITQQNRSLRIAGVGDNTNGQHLLIFLRRNGSDNSYRLNSWYKGDTGLYQAGPGMFLVFQTNPNSPRQIEVEWTASSGPGANDGSYVIRRLQPTTAEESITGLDNDTLRVDNFRQGLLAGSGSNASGGAYYFDEFESYR